MIDDLNGCTAVITGGASGLGLAMAHRFGAEGANVVIADVEEEALAAASAGLTAAGIATAAVRTDVRDPEQIEALAAAALDRFGGVHVLCNNAGVVTSGPVEDTTLEQWRWVVDVNLWGVVHGCRTFLPLLRRHGRAAHIVNTASMAGLDSGPYMASYFATKFAVVALTESVWYEQQLAGSQVGVSVLCPGFVRTRIAQAERNRPDGVVGWVAGDSEEARTFAGYLTAGVESGIDAAAVAERVRDAIATDRFYVLTHPDDAHTRVSARAASIIEGAKPPRWLSTVREWT
jgi:NAD(P)-dependent dehydrogenase (short-subunit alcohol dehydrogenase family)